MNVAHTDDCPLIVLDRVAKTYVSGTLATEVLHGISLAIHYGEYVAITGASGSGKSTLMNLIGCLDRPTTGRILFANHDISLLNKDDLARLRRNTFGFIFQQYNLLPTASAEENVEMPAMYAGVRKKERLTQARTLLSTLGLGDRLHHRPNQLSGGQQQRVAIARALINGGRVILADEPTGALDSHSGQEILALLQRLNHEGHTIILITHDATVAQQADRIITMADGIIMADTGRTKKMPSQQIVQQDLPGTPSGETIDFLETISMALHALGANLFRTILTLLGIIIGVGSVVAMLALGDGAKQDVLTRIQAMGSNLLMVRSGPPNKHGGGQAATLMPEDAEAIAKLPNVRHAVPEISGNVTLRLGNRDTQTSVTATSADFPGVRDWSVENGIFFTADDVKRYAPVVVLGQTVREKLFDPGSDPLGGNLLINNVPFLVIGTLATKGGTVFGSDMDDAVFVPISTGSLRLLGQRHLRSINVEVADVDMIDATQDAITDLLTARHRTIDFQVRNMASILETATETQNTMTLLLGSIATISLLVGGIGVMNIMLVSVTERTREIGIRMATGGRTVHILAQFLIEALMVCLLGGLVGVGGGLLTALIAQKMGVSVLFSFEPVILAFSFALITGLLFGYMPARKAANLDPVTALAAK